MLKNKDVKRLIFINIIIIIVFTIITIGFNYRNYQLLNKLIIDNNAYVANTLIEKHPELEDEIIEAIIDAHNNDKKILNKYGLDNIEVYNQFAKVKSLKKQIIFNNVVIVSVMFMIMLLVTIIYIIREHQQIKKINKYLYKVLSDNYTFDIREYEEGDISNLRNDIYKVTTKLKNMSEKSIADKKYLESVLSDISHQIKTPLTSMYVINDLLLNDEMDAKTRKEFLNKNRLQLERMEWLVGSLLKMSRLDSGSEVLNHHKVVVKDLINIALEPLKIPMELKDITLITNIPDNIYFEGDLKWSSEALINIIKNAYEHTPIGGEIKIVSTDNPLYVEISITDNGEGISEEEIPLIFKRFYKGSSNKESIGIGLNMAKMIIEKQNGVIEVNSEKGKYTTFIIRIYKKNI